MQDDKAISLPGIGQLPTTDQMLAVVQQLEAETRRLINEASQAAAAGEGDAYYALVERVTANVSALAQQSVLTTQVTGAMREAFQLIQRQRDNAIQDKAVLEANFQEFVEQAVASELEAIFQNNDYAAMAETEWIAERMLDEGKDAVKQDIRLGLEQQLHEAENMADHYANGWDHVAAPDDDKDDDPESED